MKIKIRARFFLAVEGESEQSFIKWLQQLSDKRGLHIHLDCQPLNGGSYKTMLRNALYAQQHHERYKAKASVLLVDGDRAEHDDNWTIAKLAQEAAKENFLLCLQNPNYEGLLLRMMPGKEYVQPPSASAYKELVKLWPSY